MGCICSCLAPEQHEEAKPLLRDQPPVSRVPDTTAGIKSNNSGSTQSARRRAEPDKEQTFLKSVDEITEIHLEPTSLPVLDKSLQDHATLHNTVLDNHKSLRSVIHEFKELFVTETAGIPVMTDCVQLMKEKCGNAELSVSRRSKFCIQIEYDSQKVSKEAKTLPENVISALELFNRANKLTKDIMERAPNVSKSVQLILDDENSLRKEVTKADLGPTQGPEAMKNCVENISKLRKIPGAMECIQRDTQRIFDELLKGSKNLFEGTESKFVTT